METSDMTASTYPYNVIHMFKSRWIACLFGMVYNMEISDMTAS